LVGSFGLHGESSREYTSTSNNVFANYGRIRTHWLVRYQRMWPLCFISFGFRCQWHGRTSAFSDVGRVCSNFNNTITGCHLSIAAWAWVPTFLFSMIISNGDRTIHRPKLVILELSKSPTGRNVANHQDRGKDPMYNQVLHNLIFMGSGIGYARGSRCRYCGMCGPLL